MGRIFCIMGMSGTGKDTVYKCLIHDRRLRLRGIVTYTTRPMRDGERQGVEYRFVSVADLDRLRAARQVVEERHYDTVQGRWYYFTADDGQIDLRKNNYLMIATPEAFVRFKARFGRERVVPLYIRVEDGERLRRALHRERRRRAPDYEEMCRRFLADKEDFSPEKLARAGIEKTYDNSILKNCLAVIRADILGLL